MQIYSFLPTNRLKFIKFSLAKNYYVSTLCKDNAAGIKIHTLFIPLSPKIQSSPISPISPIKKSGLENQFKP